MKAALIALCSIATHVVPCEGEERPASAPSSEAPIDHSKKESSQAFLADNMLEAFDEPRLDKGLSEGEIIRISVYRSFHPPLMFLWAPGRDGSPPTLKVKRIAFETYSPIPGSKPLRTWPKFEKEITLDPTQDKLLRSLYSSSPIEGLPQACWTPSILDGSEWIFEHATSKDYTIISRRNPINPPLEPSAISTERLAAEMKLARFGVAVWVLAGIDEELY